MSIKKIEIVCVPCLKCFSLKRRIELAIKCIETQYKIKITYDFKHIKDLRLLGSKYSISPAYAPVIVINGHAEAGKNISQNLLKMKLFMIHQE